MVAQLAIKYVKKNNMFTIHFFIYPKNIMLLVSRVVIEKFDVISVCLNC